MAGVLAVHRDAESKEVRHEAILNRVNDAIFTVDVQGRFQDVNGRLCALTGYPARELLERSLFELLTSDERAKFVQTTAEVYVAGEVRHSAFPAPTPTGGTLTL